MNDLVKDAKASRERLEDRLTKIEHSLCVVAQVVADHIRPRYNVPYPTDKHHKRTYVSDRLVQLIADLTPEPKKSVSITLPDNECNDPEPQREYGEDE